MKIIQNLLKIKSIISLCLTFTFCYLAISGKITEEQYVVIFTMVIGFYFGTQSNKDKSVEINTDEQN